MTAPDSPVPDIDFTFKDFRFSLRAAVMVLHGGQVLVCHEPNLDVCYLPGGRIQLGEDSLAAAKRELLEETGQDVGPLRLALVTEEFFLTPKGGPHHGRAFYYVAESPPAFPTGAFANLSAEGHWFEWVSLERLEEAQLMPPFLRSALLNLPSEGVQHLVSRR